MLIGIVKFAEFELDSGRYELRRGDHVLKLEKIPMEILTLLVRSEGRLVAREEIVEMLSGHLCRCTGYDPIVDAIAEVAGSS